MRELNLKFQESIESRVSPILILIQKCVSIYAQPLNTPFNFPFHKPGVEELRKDNPDAFLLKLHRDNERFKIPGFRTSLTTGRCTDSS